MRYFNWCGHPDGMSAAIRRLGPRRDDLRVAVQLAARDAPGARAELDGYLRELGTDHLDVVTHYYLEREDGWAEIVAPGGAAEALREARLSGGVRAVGVTTHQRALAAKLARQRAIDLLIIRYSAAHRGAETEVFPETDALGVPVVAYTCPRWERCSSRLPTTPRASLLRAPQAPANARAARMLAFARRVSAGG